MAQQLVIKTYLGNKNGWSKFKNFDVCGGIDVKQGELIITQKGSNIQVKKRVFDQKFKEAQNLQKAATKGNIRRRTRH